MYAKTFILLLAVASVIGKSVSSDQENNTDIENLIRQGLVGFVPIVLRLEDFSTTGESQSDHKVQKRSAVEGDHPHIDLLANFEEANNDKSLTELEGRIKTLPTWVG